MRLKAVAYQRRNRYYFGHGVIEEAEASLNRTPDLLPVLKDVGVVDSGGKGLLCVYEGFWLL